MKNSKHTPAPWTYDNGDDYVREDATGYCLARIFEDNAHPDPKYIEDLPKEANAHLIAAAPDLLALLEELSNVEIKGHGLLSGLQFSQKGRDLSERICAAIAKAKGESHA